MDGRLVRILIAFTFNLKITISSTLSTNDKYIDINIHSFIASH